MENDEAGSSSVLKIATLQQAWETTFQEELVQVEWSEVEKTYPLMKDWKNEDYSFPQEEIEKK